MGILCKILFEVEEFFALEFLKFKFFVTVKNFEFLKTVKNFEFKEIFPSFTKSTRKIMQQLALHKTVHRLIAHGDFIHQSCCSLII